MSLINNNTQEQAVLNFLKELNIYTTNTQYNKIDFKDVFRFIRNLNVMLKEDLSNIDDISQEQIDQLRTYLNEKYSEITNSINNVNNTLTQSLDSYKDQTNSRLDNAEQNINMMYDNMNTNIYDLRTLVEQTQNRAEDAVQQSNDIARRLEDHINVQGQLWNELFPTSATSQDGYQLVSKEQRDIIESVRGFDSSIITELSNRISDLENRPVTSQSLVTSTEDGLMSKEDKVKLDGLGPQFFIAGAGEGSVKGKYGNELEANGKWAFAYGSRSKAIGNYSIALGNRSKANGSNTISLGNVTEINNSFSIGVGTKIATYGAHNYIFGYGGSAVGNFSSYFGGNISGYNLYLNKIGNEDRKYELFEGDISMSRALKNVNFAKTRIAPDPKLSWDASNPSRYEVPFIEIESSRFIEYRDNNSSKIEFTFKEPIPTEYFKGTANRLVSVTNCAVGAGSISFGGLAIGESSVTFNTAVAGGRSSVAIGHGTVAGGDYSVAIGTQVDTLNSAEIALGNFNVSYENEDKNKSSIFTIGGGRAPGAWGFRHRNNAMTILGDGSVYFKNVGGYTGGYDNKPIEEDGKSLQTVLSELQESVNNTNNWSILDLRQHGGMFRSEVLRIGDKIYIDILSGEGYIMFMETDSSGVDVTSKILSANTEYNITKLGYVYLLDPNMYNTVRFYIKPKQPIINNNTVVSI